jgi:hypothetical protein
MDSTVYFHICSKETIVLTKDSCARLGALREANSETNKQKMKSLREKFMRLLLGKHQTIIKDILKVFWIMFTLKYRSHRITHTTHSQKKQLTFYGITLRKEVSFFLISC